MLLIAALSWPIAKVAAHGHPVSEALYNGNVYIPPTGRMSSGATALMRSVDAVYTRHLRIKVAVVAGPDDLAVLAPMWEKPARYAKHLATDLSALYVGPFLVVMPAGFSVYDGGRSVAAERRVLAHMRVQSGGAVALTHSAADAVRRMLRARALRSKDIRKPFAYVYPATVQRGNSTRLMFAIREDSLWARMVARVVTGSGTVIRTFKTRLSYVTPTETLTQTWNVPTTLPTDHVRICVVAWDGRGNRSDESCSDLTVE